MQIKKTELLEALEIVKPGLANKEIIEQTTSFAFIKGRVVTYNDSISISHPIKGLDIEGAIQADHLYKFLGKVTKDDIDLELKDNEIVFTAGRAKAGMSLQAEIKLPLEEISGRKKWQELPENFNKFIGFAMSSCSKDMSRPVITCVHVNQSGIIEASDSYRITRCDLKEELPIETFLLPATSAVDVVKINPTKGVKKEGWVHFSNEEGIEISCRIFTDTYPDTSMVLEMRGDRIILPQTINEVLERAMVFSKREHLLDEIVTITIQDKSLEISSQSKTGWFREEINMKYSGDKIVFSITPFLLKGILSETRECNISK
jgi:hypothetical protein